MHESVIVRLPDYLRRFRQSSRETVSIDAGIEKAVAHLWEKKVVTLGSCVMSPESGKPSLVIGDDEDQTRVRAILREVDDRDWELWRWNGGTIVLLRERKERRRRQTRGRTMMVTCSACSRVRTIKEDSLHQRLWILWCSRCGRRTTHNS